MPDYNSILSEKQKLEIIKKMLDKELDKLQSALLPETNPDRLLEAWEAYYAAVKELNERFDISRTIEQ